MIDLGAWASESYRVPLHEVSEADDLDAERGAGPPDRGAPS